MHAAHATQLTTTVLSALCQENSRNKKFCGGGSHA